MQKCENSVKLWNRDGGDWRSTADDNGSCHELTPSFFEEMTHCRCQKHCRRLPGNPNGWTKFRQYRAYFPILSLRDRDWLFAADGGFRRSLKRHVADLKKNRRQWPGSIEIPQILKFMPKRSSKTSWKTSFWCWYAAIMMPLWTVFFPTITRNGLCCHLWKIIYRRPWPQPRYTYWRVSL